jgi:diguanylate cyclase (GGDEF)-like protein
MIAPNIPDDEVVRLNSLRALDILDTSREERFDRLTRMAQRIFKVPIAMVSLVDEDRQWFKSCVGIATRETRRSISFCGHAILDDAIFIVEDASRDERFSDNPLVSGEPHVRFYAGCPLRYLDGSRLGALCLIDTKPRTLDPDQQAILRDLAELVERELAAVQLATMDELTQLANRRGFISMAGQSLSLCMRQELPATLVFFDLNKFKRINDDFGHAEGDRALRAFAGIMRRTFRHSDVLARLGGDEFVVFLSDATLGFVDEILDRFRRSLGLLNRTADRGYDIAFAQGVVNVDARSTTSIEDLLARADALMYQQKSRLAESGR